MVIITVIITSERVEQYCPLNGPAYSMCTRGHGLMGFGQGVKVVLKGDFANLRPHRIVISIIESYSGPIGKCAC